MQKRKERVMPAGGKPYPKGMMPPMPPKKPSKKGGKKGK